MDLQRKLFLLRQDRLLQVLPPDEMDRVGREATHHNFSSGQYIYTSGESAHSIFFLKMGTVMLSVTSPEGKEKILALIRPGDMFGELVLAPGLTRRRSHALACDDAFACSLSLQQMTSLMLRHPILGLQMARLMAQKVSESQDEVELLSFATTESRLTIALLRLAQEQPGTEPQVRFQLTHEHLARMVGASRETVTGILGKLRRQGAIEFAYGTVTVNRAVLGARLQSEGGNPSVALTDTVSAPRLPAADTE